ncbi:TPA: hypothetical protein KP562_003913 [Clostridioides difficile]|uniref:hypothetical protein n=1 Tax=Clostridioides difficile TaxID=1496 RepID=UPI0005DCFF51|nr:hypothetical protein [Clostridioides difficile]KJF61648.1 hypothetical protein TZ54_19630 [Clostridioides difficile]KJF61665.1 hypothetical protein TZ54_19735 [Clostridioides difficile]MDN4765948.1 hypothetical protein [Clostridioides difficile]VIG11956.1 Uncharacterised protein [Clostridioides difficile]HBE9438573.1 hypothetical protein [Clostridioides difficile]
MEGTKRSYRKIPKLDLRKVKLADVFEKNEPGVFRVNESDEQLLYDCLEETQNIREEKHLEYAIRFRGKSVYCVFYEHPFWDL